MITQHKNKSWRVKAIVGHTSVRFQVFLLVFGKLRYGRMVDKFVGQFLSNCWCNFEAYFRGIFGISCEIFVGG